MKEIIILCGISGSGKSSFATDFIKENSNYLRINRDDIRKTLVGDLNGYYQKKNLNEVEKVVTFTEDDIFDNCINRNYNIIVDNTNLKQSYINRWLESIENINIINYGKYDFKFKLFDISLEEACNRVMDRDFKNSVSMIENVKYIEKQFENYQNIKEYILKNYKDKIIE